jgi:hypothetical protein
MFALFFRYGQENGNRQEYCEKKETAEVFRYHKAFLLRCFTGIGRRLSDRFPSITIQANR